MSRDAASGAGGDAQADPATADRITGQRLVVALVRGLHGLNGAIRVEILTDRPEDRYAPGTVLHREGSEEPLTVAWSSPVSDGPGWRLGFDEITSREAADGLRGAYLEWVAEPDAELARGEYFWHEVIGTKVSGVDGAELGTVRDVYRSGGAEVFLVDGGPYGEFDVPAVRAFVRVFAPRRGEIVVDTEALDLTVPRRLRGSPTGRPKAPRRRPGPRRPKAVAPAEASDATAEASAAAETPPESPPASPTPD